MINIKKQRHYFAKNFHIVRAMAFPVVMFGCDSWTIKKPSAKELMLLNCDVGEDSWESLGLQGGQTSQSKRKSVLNIHWKNNAEVSILRPPVVKNWLIGKDPDDGKDWRQKEKGTTEDEVVG